MHLGAARRPAWLSRQSGGEHGGGGVSEGGRGWTERESCFIPGVVGASGGWQVLRTQCLLLVHAGSICVGQQKVYSPDVPSFLSFSKELVWVNRASGGRVSDGWQGSE